VPRVHTTTLSEEEHLNNNINTVSETQNKEVQQHHAWKAKAYKGMLVREKKQNKAIFAF
jgi:hypothetical protein